MTNGYDYANPQSMTIDQHGNTYLYENYGSQNGLTKREYFAAILMQGLLSSPSTGTPESFATKATHCADALISELNNPNQP